MLVQAFVAAQRRPPEQEPARTRAGRVAKDFHERLANDLARRARPDWRSSPRRRRTRVARRSRPPGAAADAAPAPRARRTRPDTRAARQQLPRGGWPTARASADGPATGYGAGCRGSPAGSSADRGPGAGARRGVCHRSRPQRAGRGRRPARARLGADRRSMPSSGTGTGRARRARSTHARGWAARRPAFCRSRSGWPGPRVCLPRSASTVAT